MTHDDETVERVARAINAARYGDIDDTRDPPAFEDEDKSGQVYAYRLARAALSAMPPRELLREALEALEVFADLLEPEDESRPDGWMSHVFLDLRSVRRARAAADKIRAALEHQQKGEPKP